jgi:hypothetical protein
MEEGMIPEGFRWLDERRLIVGSDYDYRGQVLLSFPKGVGGPIRYVAMDENRRLFIHNGKQCGYEAADAPPAPADRPPEATEAIARVREHVAHHAGRQQAYFSVAGMRALLDEIERLSAAPAI